MPIHFLNLMRRNARNAGNGALPVSGHTPGPAYDATARPAQGGKPEREYKPMDLYPPLLGPSPYTWAETFVREFENIVRKRGLTCVCGSHAVTEVTNLTLAYQARCRLEIVCAAAGCRRARVEWVPDLGPENELKRQAHAATLVGNVIGRWEELVSLHTMD